MGENMNRVVSGFVIVKKEYQKIKKTSTKLLLALAATLIFSSASIFTQAQSANNDHARTGTIEQKIWGLMMVWSEA